MIICHTHKFIYLKTPKTAGTSIEVFFEQFCEEGDIVGKRGKGEKKLLSPPDWYHHMHAPVVRRKIGRKIWNSYFKFCAVRNPWDLVVSRYWYACRRESVNPKFQDLIANRRSHKNNFPKYHSIRGKFAMDFCIRYERLHEDIQHVCSVLSLPCDLSTLPTLKSQFRKSPDHYSLYYSEESKERIREHFCDEIERFNYAFETQDATSQPVSPLAT